MLNKNELNQEGKKMSNQFRIIVLKLKMKEIGDWAGRTEQMAKLTKTKQVQVDFLNKFARELKYTWNRSELAHEFK